MVLLAFFSGSNESPLSARALSRSDPVKVMQCLLDEGFEVIPVNPGLAGQTLLGCEVVGSLEAISEPVDMVDVFRQPSLLPEIVQSTISIAAPLLWTQLISAMRLLRSDTREWYRSCRRPLSRD